ncbi:hypothetical protein BUALT_Bualt01G0004100 [Buddleja alternifolia]|uniref:Inhibitor I9 domain-containing protein n=1 Tax=Buddleja alternifolia TaxID=168488 RepID=A0AAV6Y3D8_9LAMI|nr:hypothetical protein BUALT_Bualt01G0004100 [Buddleja alternifolia]
MKGGVVFSFLIILPSVLLIMNTQVDASHAPSHSPLSTPKDDTHIYVVYTSGRPSKDQNKLAYYLKILSSAIGSETANEALIRSYSIVSGFAAKLYPRQVALLKKQPEVAYVIRDAGAYERNV